jgi:hypothetical protein
MPSNRIATALLAAALLATALLAGCTTQTDSNHTAPPRSETPSPAPDATEDRAEHGDSTAPAPPTTPTTSVTPSLPAPSVPTHVGHVFTIVLENEGYNTTFPASDPPSPYLATTLPTMGRMLTHYYGTGHASLDNYIAMTSGQAPNPATQGDCAFYADFHEATQLDGQDVGQGCVYPKDAVNIGDQLTASNHTWKAYAEDMANVPATAPTACRHQAINSQDTWQGSTDTADQYATRHVPFVYYHSIIDDPTYCNAHVVDLRNLTTDLQSLATTPEYVFITPDVCSDGHDGACVSPDQKGGYDGIDGFLRTWIPRIMNSTAYQQDGLILVNFDEADVSPADQDGGTACCGEPAGYNTPMPGIFGPGGGRTGAVLLSPCLIPGSIDDTPYDHYSMLRTIEDIFAVKHVGYAAQAGLTPMGLGTCTPAAS